MTLLISLMLMVFAILGPLIVPLAALAQTPGPAGQSTVMLTAIAGMLSQMSGLAGPVLTKLLRKGMNVIPHEYLPILSVLGGVVATALTATFSGGPAVTDANVMNGAATGGLAHWLMQTDPIKNGQTPQGS